jgi:hypothetical protein
MNGPEQSIHNHGDQFQHTPYFEAFDRVITKGRQLQALLALMTITAIDEEVIPANRMTACQLAFDLTAEIVSAVDIAIRHANPA